MSTGHHIWTNKSDECDWSVWYLDFPDTKHTAVALMGRYQDSCKTFEVFPIQYKFGHTGVSQMMI